MSEPARRAVLITGAGGGLGLATAEVFAASGWDVFAADVAPPPAASGIIPLQLDVTSDDSVGAAATEVGRRVDGLGAVVNFAGVLELGPMLEIPAERLRRILDINVVGTHRVNRAFFPLVRAGAGRIVNISSEAALIRGGATAGPYSASKHAVEAYSDALRQELMFLGVPVVTVRPGSFRTPMSQSITARMAANVPADSEFARLARVMERVGARDERGAKDPRQLAEAVYHAVTTPRPRTGYAVGVSRARRVGGNLPRSVLDKAIRRLVERAR